MTRKEDVQIKKLTNRASSDVRPYAAIEQSRQSAHALSWDVVPSSDLKLLIAAVTACGHALMFAQTRNGGVSLSLYTEGEPVKMRRYDAEELELAIGQVTEKALSLLPPEVQEAVGKAAAV